MVHTYCAIAALLNSSAGSAYSHQLPFLQWFSQALKSFIQCYSDTLIFHLSFWSLYKMDQLEKQSFSVLGLYQQKMYTMG